MRAVGIAAVTFIAVAGILLTVATTGPQANALVTAALVAAVAYLASITRSMADLATVEKFHHEIPKLQAEYQKLRLEIEQLQKQIAQDESRVRMATESDVIKFSTGDLFRNDPPSKW